MSFRMILIMVFGLLFLYALFTVGFPFLLAIVIALFLEPVIKLLMKYGRVNRIWACTVVCTAFMIVLLGVLYLLGLKIISELNVFFRTIPTRIQEATEYIRDASRQTQLFYDSLPADMAEQVQNGFRTGVETLTKALNNLIGDVSGVFFGFARGIPEMLIFFIVFAVALYLFCFSLPTLNQSFLSLFDNKSQPKVEKVLINLRKSIFGFLRAQVVLSALTYGVTLIGLLILGVDYPLAIALLIIIVDLLPILGTGSFIVPWAAYQLITGDIFLGVGLIVLFLVITVFRRVVEPKILGDAVGIGALSALISLYVGFQLVGVVGLFLGPIVVIVYQAMRKVGLLNIQIRLE